ncbi:ACH92-like protein [Mya arenaria]|uniref:ACH92-like protein n=1 Tax=Mya arenaria TaxID=6604 RepID=A0ABY7DT68_MYAAR|nr:ACH92-like protein [Mya arenaria]
MLSGERLATYFNGCHIRNLSASIWHDERISWRKEDYNGLEVVRLPARLLWLPDIVLYNKLVA